MKKVFKTFLVVAVTAVAGYNVYQSNYSVMNNLSEFALANVEALTVREVTLDNRTPSDTYKSLELLGGGCTRITFERLCAYGGSSSCTPGTYTKVECLR